MVNMNNKDNQERNAWQLEEAFDLERISQGISKGKRHFSFKQYLGWMVKKGYSKDDALQIILAWNRLNSPPIPEEELKYLFEYYWAIWRKLPEENEQTRKSIPKGGQK